jgi:hypothetical protein
MTYAALTVHQNEEVVMSAAATIQHPAVKAVEELAGDYEKALDLLDQFCERFYWIKDHVDYQVDVRAFLATRGRQPHPYKQ